MYHPYHSMKLFYSGITPDSRPRPDVAKQIQFVSQMPSLRLIRPQTLSVVWETRIAVCFQRTKQIPIVNPLVPEFSFPLIFEIQPKSGSYRLPTHMPDAHRKFFRWSLLFFKSKFWSNVENTLHWDTKGYEYIALFFLLIMSVLYLLLYIL